MKNNLFYSRFWKFSYSYYKLIKLHIYIFRYWTERIEISVTWAGGKVWGYTFPPISLKTTISIYFEYNHDKSGFIRWKLCCFLEPAFKFPLSGLVWNLTNIIYYIHWHLKFPGTPPISFTDLFFFFFQFVNNVIDSDISEISLRFSSVVSIPKSISDLIGGTRKEGGLFFF